ncbi:hypothetical protein IAG44_16045 [Streptomyces roseirectus]|uniref:Uncharacterized protein n=1 Tax=Streptomyces roseirectus TaxID=2768066 RepID=A0A7H0IDD2_9ACTN|nr:hypothetical protein [Streptomyces roseirectus]QNP70798.1 hypothetical protein IAG44_16045 [Streptomyces roseirectus]
MRKKNRPGQGVDLEGRAVREFGPTPRKTVWAEITLAPHRNAETDASANDPLTTGSSAAPKVNHL